MDRLCFYHHCKLFFGTNVYKMLYIYKYRLFCVVPCFYFSVLCLKNRYRHNAVIEYRRWGEDIGDAQSTRG